MKKTAATPSSPRRRPVQARARQTAQALQDAFVRILVERPYATITIREVVMVAGTSLGSFYEYFSGMEDLARVSLHLRSKAMLLAMQAAIERHAGQPLAAIIDAIIDDLLAAHAVRPAEWSAHYLLERQFSGLEAYRKMYASFIGKWQAAFDAASDAAAYRLRGDAAQVCQTLMYGLVAYAHLQSSSPDHRALAAQVRAAVHGFLGIAPGRQAAGPAVVAPASDDEGRNQEKAYTSIASTPYS